MRRGRFVTAEKALGIVGIELQWVGGS
jgi:hypothetical protein